MTEEKIKALAVEAAQFAAHAAYVSPYQSFRDMVVAAIDAYEAAMPERYTLDAVIAGVKDTIDDWVAALPKPPEKG